MSAPLPKAACRDGALTKADLAALVVWRAQGPKEQQPFRKRWTPEEERDVRLMVADGKDFHAIAQRLGRSPEAARFKMLQMRRKGAL